MVSPARPGTYHQPHDQRHFAVAIGRENQFYAALADPDDLFDLGIVAAVIGTALLTQQLQRKDHILHRHRMAVRKARLRIQGEGDPGAVLRGLDAFRQQAVKRKRLVIGAGKQTLIDIFAPARRGIALDDQRIEAVEGALDAEHGATAARRRWVDIVEMSKAGGIFRLAMHGDPVAWRRIGRLRLADRQDAQNCKEESHRPSGSGFHGTNPRVWNASVAALPRIAHFLRTKTVLLMSLYYRLGLAACYGTFPHG
jgi:hypothetical protein